MTAVLALLIVQVVLGTYDTLWHHELTLRLPAQRAARRELVLHGAREVLYAAVFLGLAWREWRGAWAYLLAAILITELVLTMADFLEEDRTRRLPRMERVLHTLLAVNYGVWLGVFVPHLYRWWQQTTALTAVAYGALSVVLSVAAAGVLLSGLRNLLAGLGHLRPAYWVRHPFYIGSNATPRTLLVTGATGFIGTALVRRLLARGDAVIVLTRTLDKALTRFGPHVRAVQSLDQVEAATPLDGVINLAGAAILALPWLAARRRVLLESRLRTTHEVVRLCGRLSRPPPVLVSGSAIGFYGVGGDEERDEHAGGQARFQSELCQQWETAAAGAARFGVRVVLLRTGLVLGTDGGALPVMSLPLRCFMGATLGSGGQWMSWVHLVDVVRLIEMALDSQSVHGPLNATAPEAVRHRDFQRGLARQLRRPLWLWIPRWVLRLSLGEMAELLTDGQRVVPRAAAAAGFSFKYPRLQAALASLYPRQPGGSGSAAVYFNGQCPVCSAEIGHYARIASRTGAPLDFIDSTGNPMAFSAYGLRLEQLEERLYARDAEGCITSGFEAVLQVWRRLPRYRVAAFLLGLPVLRHVAATGYDLVVAPALAGWARRRARRRNGGILAGHSSAER